MRNKEIMRVEFFGRKKENKTGFNYRIEQVLYCKDLGDAIDQLEEKYIVHEVINY